MKKNRWYLRLLALLVLCGALNVTITAAASGSFLRKISLSIVRIIPVPNQNVKYFL